MIMPPPESHKKLTPKQIALLQAWAEQGAPYEEHWSFVPPRSVSVPTTGLDGWSDHPVDRFVAARLAREGVAPTPRADRRTLIRRLSLDLNGLPPTLEQIHSFLDDDSPRAYLDLVNRLLDRPQYGEHMARYWLDVVRFADTNGLHHDHYREMSPYRDWVIKAFNRNLPYDEFITAQIAGDLFERPTEDQQIASGFNRLHLIIDRGTALPEESFTRNVVDRVSSIGTAFLGLTLECAVCHDHKFDPITQRDFYELYAFFNNCDGDPETGGRQGLDFQRGLQPPYLEFPSDEQRARRAQLEVAIAQLEEQIEALSKQLPTDEVTTVDDEPEQEAPSGPTASGTRQHDESSEQADEVTKVQTKLAALNKRLERKEQARDDLVLSISATLVMKERDEVRPAHILVRGNYDQPGEEVERGTPGFLPPMPESSGTRTRLDLANWLVAETNPLTARVAVNRIWQQLFGTGLVRTSEDFGAQGEPPSHPALLDYLTLQFVESGWDVKALVRFIVQSQTYQQSSLTDRLAYVRDPENRLLARGSRYRLDAEVIRDQTLLVSGLLNPTLFGRSVKPPQPDGLWKIVSMPGSYPRVFTADTGEQIYRRSVYSFWKRSLPPPQMTIFDAPTRESCVARRERTNTPLQALVLMNEQQFFGAAIHFAEMLVEQVELTDTERTSLAYETVTAHVPGPSTVEILTASLDDFRRLYRADPGAAAEMIASSSSVAGEPVTDQVELAAWAMLAHSLLNLDAVRNRE